MNSSADLISKTIGILADQQAYQHISDICRRYVDENRGATEKIMRYFQENC